MAKINWKLGFTAGFNSRFWGNGSNGCPQSQLVLGAGGGRERNATLTQEKLSGVLWDALDWKMSPALRVSPALTAGSELQGQLLFVPKGGSLGTSEELPAPRQLFLLLE